MPGMAPSDMLRSGYLPKHMALRMIKDIMIADMSVKEIVSLYNQFALILPLHAITSKEFSLLVSKNKDKIR